jgi:hypothetical protein
MKGEKNMKKLNKLHRLLVVIVSLALMEIWSHYHITEVAADHCSRGQGTLSGSAINGVLPTGRAEWLGNAFCQPLEMRVEVSKVNLPDGTILSVDACGTGGNPNIVGSIRLQGGSGKMQLSKLDGDPTNDNVPFCDMRFGGIVKVFRESTIVVSGCVSSVLGTSRCMKDSAG